MSEKLCKDPYAPCSQLIEDDVEMQMLMHSQPSTLEDALVVIKQLRERLRERTEKELFMLPTDCQQDCMDCDAEAKDCSLEAYFGTSIVGHLRQRLPWLMSLLLLESVSAYSLGRFEGMLDRHMTLALFCPMIVGTAGNAGNQPGVIFTRAITTGQFNSDHSMSNFFRREAGLAGIVSFVMAFLALARTTATSEDIPSCVAVSIAIFFVILFAIGSGLGLSLLIHRCGLDPAAGAAPLLTTLSDVIGVLVLCFVSMAIFRTIGRQFDLTSFST